jgi:hypothetical protein
LRFLLTDLEGSAAGVCPTRSNVPSMSDACSASLLSSDMLKSAERFSATPVTWTEKAAVIIVLVSDPNIKIN